MHFALKHPLPLFALAAIAAIVGGLCVGAFPVGFTGLLSAVGLADQPLDDATRAVLYAIRTPRVLATFCVGAALAASGAALQSLFRNPLADPGLLGVSSGAALAAVSVIVLGEKVMHVVPPDLRPWLLPAAAFAGGLASTIVVYRLAARDGITLVGTLLLSGIAINALTAAGNRVGTAMARISSAGMIAVQVTPPKPPMVQKIRVRSCWSSATKTSMPMPAAVSALMAMPDSRSVPTRVMPSRAASR